MVSLSTTDDRLKKIDKTIEKGFFADRSTMINNAIDFWFKAQGFNYIFDFMYSICIPLMFFIIVVGLSMFLLSVFFYILAGVTGIFWDNGRASIFHLRIPPDRIFTRLWPK